MHGVPSTDQSVGAVAAGDNLIRARNSTLLQRTLNASVIQQGFSIEDFPPLSGGVLKR
jgi:hypothetical protein